MTAVDLPPIPPSSPSKVRLDASKIARAIRSDVRPTDTPHTYVVDGDPYDDDNHHVYHDPGTGDHACSCYDVPPDGAERRMTGCAHVVAVVMHLKKKAAVERLARERQDAANAPQPVVPDSDDPRFHNNQPPWPDWFQAFRPEQWRGIDQVMEAFDAGAKTVLLQGPPGSGKTVIGETVHRLIGGSALYVCTTRSLQDQAARAFPYAQVLKGRANYPTLTGQVDSWGRRLDSRYDQFRNLDSSITVADCTGTPCRWCDPTYSCPYRVARDRAQASPLAILNTAYAIVDWNRARRRFAGRDLCIIDEADRLEGELLSQVEVTISRRRREMLKITQPSPKTVSRTDPQSTFDRWAEWVQDEAIPRVGVALRGMPSPESPATTPAQIRTRKSYEDLSERLHDLLAELPRGGWVHDGYNRGDVTFRPVQVDRWGTSMLWPHAQRYLLMSGTIISADEMADSLGIPDGYELVDIPMTFPAANRPINIVALVEMRQADIETAWPKMLKGVAGVLRLHPDERILVHTVSYALAEYLVKNLPESARPFRHLYTYKTSRERDGALAAYKQDPRGVLLAPSMDRGVDLPDDLCTVAVICKVPYPNLGDKRTSQRLHGTRGGEAWYAVNTVRSLVQMTGRGVRHGEDRCTVYILDHVFTTGVWKRNKRLLPSWWCDAVNWHFPLFRLLRDPSS